MSRDATLTTVLYSTSPLHQPVDGVLEGSYHFPHFWQDPGAVSATLSGEPVGVGHMRIVQLLIGDEITGPIFTFANIAPGCTIPADAVKKGAHNHRTDTFRMPVLDLPHPQLKDSGKWLSAGEFLLLGANKVYVEDISSAGVTLFGFYADRRGYPHGFDARYPEGTRVKEWPATNVAMFGPDHVWPAHERDEDAVPGLAATFTEVPSGSPASVVGSFDDDAHWSELTDGSTFAAAFLGDRASGSVALLSNNAGDAVEAPAARRGTDTVRLVIEGSVTIGDRAYGRGDFRVTAAGVVEGPVVHGPEGSSQVLVVADRRHWLPVVDDGDTAVECPRLGEMAAVLDAHLAELTFSG